MEDSSSGSGSGSGSGSILLPSKRQRTLSPKGKEKMEETTTKEEAICGICLLSGGLKVRGLIDSCDHYFCFICIMEWAKVESRCPMCKQRFHFIRRPEVSGLFTSESVLEIPVRDQVYHPLGNESSALSDPYAQVNCKVCHGTDHDELLLLCDLCDSASHTYCVNLGYTVPEDNWYCHDCTILREEQAKIDRDADNNSQNNDTHVQDQQRSASVFDIVTDERFFPTEQLPLQQFNEISMSRSSTTQQRIYDGLMLNIEQSECESSPVSGPDSHLQLKDVRQRARTLRHSRNIHVRLQAFRKNWNALRSGSLIFSSVLDSNDDMMPGTEQRGSRTNSDLLQESKSTTLVNNDLLTDSNISSNSSSISELQDIKRAWKMMQKAKKPQLSLANSSLNVVSKNKITADKVAGYSTPGAYKKLSIQAVHERHEPIGFCQKFQSSNQPQHGNRLAAKTSISMQFTPKKNRVLTKEFVGSVKEVLPIRPSSNVSETTRSFLSKTTFEIGGELPQVRRAAARICIDGTSKWNGILDNNAKSEIQSMVKLNLMLLSKGGCLGNKKFKEIARASTHSILAACGLEHLKSHARHFSNQVCRHTRPMQRLHSSAFMPGSCKDCFDSFVKDVVNSILLEKST